MVPLLALGGVEHPDVDVKKRDEPAVFVELSQSDELTSECVRNKGFASRAPDAGDVEVSAFVNANHEVVLGVRRSGNVVGERPQ